jgi:hypothetical protein
MRNSTVATAKRLSSQSVAVLAVCGAPMPIASTTANAIRNQ